MGRLRAAGAAGGGGARQVRLCGTAAVLVSIVIMACLLASPPLLSCLLNTSTFQCSTPSKKLRTAIASKAPCNPVSCPPCPALRRRFSSQTATLNAMLRLAVDNFRRRSYLSVG